MAPLAADDFTHAQAFRIRPMTWVDYSIALAFVVSVLVGIWRGFTREILSLATWIVAVGVAWLFGQSVADYLKPWLADAVLRDAAGAALTFIATLFVGAILTHFIVIAVRDSRFSPADRTMGGGLGIVRGVIMVSLFVVVSGRMGASQDSWWQQSMLIQQFTPLARGFETIIPPRWLEWLEPGATPTNPT